MSWVKSVYRMSLYNILLLAWIGAFTTALIYILDLSSLLCYLWISLGEFGVVYRGKLINNCNDNMTNLVAIKTLKGLFKIYNGNMFRLL